MSTPLLDVNLLMALLWQNHEEHARARRWLRGRPEFATCPLGQLGFVRISSHPTLGYGMLPAQALHVLRRLLADPRHRFVADDLGCEDHSLQADRIMGANHVTDHYLVALARRHGMTLITFDEPLIRTFTGEPGLVAPVP